MQIIEFEKKFHPRPYQRPLFNEFFIKEKKRILRICHRRFGKDTEAFNLCWAAALMRPGLYLYLLPKIEQARTVIWQGRGKDGRAWLDYIPKKLVTNTNNTMMKINLPNGSILRVTGADNYEALIGSNPLGIVFSEYQSTNPLAWDLLRPILAENDGWAFFNGTPRGHNHLYDMYEQNKDNPLWFTSLLTVNDTKYEDGRAVISPEIIEQERRSGMAEEIIQQEFYCSFEAAIQGAYFSNEMQTVKKEGRISVFPVDPNIPVHTAWDIGMRDATSIGLYQVHPNNEVKLIYHFEEYRQPVHYYAFELKKIQQQLGFKRYGIHFAPHDIRVQEWGSGRTRIEQAQSAGINFRIVPNHKIVERIQCIRAMFPRFHFHENNCKHLIRACHEYHAVYDEKRKVYGKAPDHDWSSHSIDQLGYFAVGYMDSYDQQGLIQQKKYASFIP